MNVTEKLTTIISKLEASLSYEDWKMVEESVDDLNYLYEEMQSSFPMDEYDDDDF
jgi:hypothetical protein